MITSIYVLVLIRHSEQEIMLPFYLALGRPHEETDQDNSISNAQTPPLLFSVGYKPIFIKGSHHLSAVRM